MREELNGFDSVNLKVARRAKTTRESDLFLYHYQALQVHYSKKHYSLCNVYMEAFNNNIQIRFLYTIFCHLNRTTIYMSTTIPITVVKWYICK